MSSFLKNILLAITKFFDPLREIDSIESIFPFLNQFGWVIDEDFPGIQVISNITELIGFLDSIDELIENINDNSENSDKLGELAVLIMDLADNINDLSKINGSSFHPFNLEGFWTGLPAQNGFPEWNGLPKELLTFLTIDFFKENITPIYGIFVFLGIFEENFIEDNPQINDRTKYTNYSIFWDRIPLIFSDFSQLMKLTYKWGLADENFEYNKFISNINTLANSLGFNSTLSAPSENLIRKIFNVDSENAIEPVETKITVINYLSYLTDAIATGNFDVIFLPIPKQNLDQDSTPNGFMISFESNNALDYTFHLSEILKLVFEGRLSSDGNIRLEIRPDGDINMVIDEIGDLTTSLELVFEDILPILLIGTTKTSNLSLKKLKSGINLNYIDNEINFKIYIKIEEFKITLKGGEGDGFINKIFPKNPIIIKFNLELGYDTNSGVYIEGGGSFEFKTNLNLSLGPILIQDLMIKIYLADGEILSDIGINVAVELGPLQASIQNVGLNAKFLPGVKGLFPDADIKFDFKPPNGIGLNVDASSVKGGGFLSLDKPDYFGVLELAIADKIALTAFGMLTTKMPDGSDGFSLLISLAVQFDPGIQIAFGFALNGIGGLIGINRSMSETGLRQAIKNHTLDLIMFPESPVKDATKLITLIKSVFPVQEGRFVFGPFVKLYWGGPTKLVEFALGVFIELGGPVKIAIIGNAHAALPTDEAPIIELNLDILGFLDFGKKTFALDATIYKSNILKIVILQGDLALRSNWGDKPDFAFSMGGFHPQFTPPEGFPLLKRIGATIGKSSVRISLTLYLAVTTNSFQTGSKLDIYAGSGSFNVKGGFSFDALIKFSPFSFLISTRIWAGIFAGSSAIISLDISANFSGPNPFHIWGKASFKILFIKITISVDETFGNSLPEHLPTMSPATDLSEQLTKAVPMVELPPWANEGVILTEGAEEQLSPLGVISLSQNLVPLGIKMQKYGGGVPASNEDKLSVDVVGNVEQLDCIKTYFAPGNFRKMSETEKLSSPPFEKYCAGVRFKGTGMSSSIGEDRDLEFDTIIIQDDIDPNSKQELDTFSLTQLATNGQLELVNDLQTIWSFQGSRKYYSTSFKKVDPNNPNFVSMDDDLYTLTTDELVDVQNNIFKRFEKDGTPASDMPYQMAVDLANSLVNENVVVRNIIYAN